LSRSKGGGGKWRGARLDGWNQTAANAGWWVGCNIKVDDELDVGDSDEWSSGGEVDGVANRVRGQPGRPGWL
jgi:hypothetical protein